MDRFVLAILLAVAAAADAAPVDQAQREVAQYEAYRQPDKLVAALALAPGMRVADVGAGRGLVSGRLAVAVGPRGHVVALDVNAAALAAIGARPNLETRTVRPDDPALEPRAYNRILLAEVDHLLPDRAAYLRKLTAALAPGGFIAVSNRLLYREPLLAAATAAGLRASEPPVGLPGHFFIRLEPH